MQTVSRRHSGQAKPECTLLGRQRIGFPARTVWIPVPAHYPPGWHWNYVQKLDDVLASSPMWELGDSLLRTFASRR
jgi:hypothetical protein